MKFEIFKFNSVNSTNDEAINLIKSGEIKAGCVFADYQTSGRGTQGRKWISEKGNLFVSIFFPLRDNFPTFNEFSFINSTIIADVIGHFCNKKKVGLKFPNDIFVNKKKICGILQEVITLNNIKFLIIGIGVNIISHPDIQKDYQATNILYEAKKSPKVKEIIDLLISSYENFFININSYDYKYFKKKAESMVLN